MKKKLLLSLIVAAIFTCLFAIAVSATPMSMYTEFPVYIDGQADPTTVYCTVSDAYTPTIELDDGFFTQPDNDDQYKVDASTIVKIDLSNAKPTGARRDYIARTTALPQSQMTRLTEVKLVNNSNYTDVAHSFAKGITTLTTIDFGSATKTIDSAFEGCTGITELVLPERIIQTNNNSFKGCTGLTRLEILGEVNVHNSVFQGCTSLADVTLVKVKNIGNGMFYGCSSLTEITIPETATSIGSTAFMGTQIVSLHIPANVTSLGTQMVENVTTFTTLTFAEGSKLTSIGHRCFQYSNLTGDIVLPEGLTSMSTVAFASTNITSITIPSTLSNVPDNAFQKCDNLETVVLPNNLTAIGSNAFDGCTSLTEINVPNTVTSIGSNAFNNCTSATITIDITKLTSIGGYAFKNFTGLTGVIDISLATSIGEYAFENCTGITGVKLNSTLTSIGKGAFKGCTGITEINLPSTLTSIGDSCFQGCTSITEVTIPDSVTYLGSSSFQGCSSLAEVNISASSNISNGWISVFRGCSSLTSIFVPPMVTELKYDNFWDCTSLTEIKFSEGLKTITGGNNFANCANLTTIVFPNSLETLAGGNMSHFVEEISFGNGLKSITGEGALMSVALKRVYIPAGLTGMYKRLLGYGSAGDSSMNITFIFTGTKSEAEALQALYKSVADPGHDANNKKFYDATLVSADEYDVTQEPSGFTFVYGYNACNAFYKGEHNEGPVEMKFDGQKYVSNFVNASTCTRCALDFVVGEPICGPLFDDLGYSTEDEGTAFAYAVIVNSTNIDKYIEVTGDTLVYGFIVGLYAENSTGDIINAEGVAQIANSIVFDFSDPNYDNLNRFELKFTNITNAELGLYCNAYVINDTEVSYIGAVTEDYKAAPITFANLPKKNKE